MGRTLVLWVGVVFLAIRVAAQPVLPEFSLSSKANGKVLISWHNNFQTVTQISIQRSADSLKNFTTLLSVPDPIIPENGFVDSKAPRAFMYYRLFIVLENGNYLFSKSQRAEPATDGAVAHEPAEANDNLPARSDNQRIVYAGNNGQQLRIEAPSNIKDLPHVEINKIIYVRQQDSVLKQIPYTSLRKFRDSMLNKTKDTLVFVDSDTILIKTFVPKEVYRISYFVYTGKDGNITIALPDAGNKKIFGKVPGTGPEFPAGDKRHQVEVIDCRQNKFCACRMVSGSNSMKTAN